MKQIILRRIGKFYHAFDDDAIILAYLFGYKYNQRKCGFPEITLEKVKEQLEKLNVFYKIIDDEEYEFIDGKNKYDEILKEAQEKIKLDETKEKLKERIMLLDYNALIKIETFLDNLK